LISISPARSMKAKKMTTKAVDHIDRLRSVLSAMGIKRGTFVDDQFSPNFEDAWARSRAAVGSKSADLLSAWGVGRWETDSAEDDRPAAETQWNNRPHPAQVELMRAVDTLTSADAPAVEPADVRFFSEFWPNEACPLDEIEPRTFDGAYIDNLLLAQGPSILFLDLSFGEGDPRGGIRLLKDVLTADQGRKTICVIFTQQAGVESADYWAELAAAEGIDPGRAVAISKGAIKSAASFEAELRRAFLNGLAPELVKWATDIAKEALERTTANIRFEGDVLNAIVLRSSEKEGVQPMDTLFRLIDEEFRQERDRMAVKDGAREAFGHFKTKLEALARIAPKDQLDPPLSSRVRNLMRNHLYRKEVGTAEWPPPIWMGDLWEVSFDDGANEPFVLIAQPCDIILRAKDGCRSQEWAVLVPLKRNAGKHPETVVELKYFDDGDYHSRWASLKRARVANVNVLDIVALFGPVIQKSEVAQLRARAHVYASVALRITHLAKWLEEVPPESIAAAQKLALFAEPGPVAKLSNSSEVIDFHCKRIGRIEPELARLLLQRYGNFVARYALPHDFADYEV